VHLIYAILGCNLFTYVQHGDSLSDDRNFNDVGSAMLLLFQATTGDDWSGIMDDCLINEERGCDPELGDCGSPVALPFFVSFMMISSFVLLNLVVAIVLDNFTQLGNQDPDLASSNDIDIFKEVWASYDPDADGLVPVDQLPHLVLEVPQPLGLTGTKLADLRKARIFCVKLHFTQESGHVKFRDVLDGLVQRNYKNRNVEVTLDSNAKAVQEIKVLRMSSVSNGAVLHDDNLPLSSSRRDLSAVYAKDLLGEFVARKKAHKLSDGNHKEKQSLLGRAPRSDGGAPSPITEDGRKRPAKSTNPPPAYVRQLG